MNTTGYCGKLPQRGDFVSGRIPTTFMNTWDDWAQQLVTVSNQIKLTTGKNSWFNLPVYRFYLSTGIAGESAWVGLMLPSSDSVGREYPFCLARDIEPNSPPDEALALHQNFFVHAEQLIEQLFNNNLDFSDINDSLNELDMATTISTDSYSSSSISRPSAEAALCIRQTSPADTNDTMFWKNAATALLRSSCSAYSIWSTSPLSNSTQETLICEAMPSASISSNLFIGNFSPQQWTVNISPEQPLERREENIFTPVVSAPIAIQPTTDDTGDTKPLRKSTDPKLPHEADFLELDDDSDQPDAPWDN